MRGAAFRIAAGERLELRETVVPGDLTRNRPRLELWTLAGGELPQQLVVHDKASASVDLVAAEPDQVFGKDLIQDAASEIIAIDPRAGMFATHVFAGLLPAGGVQQCVLDVSPWDFHWQEEYSFVDSITVDRGDRIVLECAYDNSAGNQPLIDGVQRSPQRVQQGDGLYDERCEFDIWRLQPYR